MGQESVLQIARKEEEDQGRKEEDRVNKEEKVSKEEDRFTGKETLRGETIGRETSETDPVHSESIDSKPKIDGSKTIDPSNRSPKDQSEPPSTCSLPEPPQKRIKNTAIFGSSFTTVTFDSLASKSTQNPSFLDTDEQTSEGPSPNPNPNLTLKSPGPEHCSETGEEDESTVFQCRCKLYAFTDGEWKDRGVGTLKINLSSDSSTARLLMRNDAVKNIMLNARLFHKMPLVKKSQSKAVQFACISGAEDKSMTNYLCKCSNEALADQLLQHIEQLIPSE